MTTEEPEFEIPEEDFIRLLAEASRLPVLVVPSSEGSAYVACVATDLKIREGGSSPAAALEALLSTLAVTLEVRRRNGQAEPHSLGEMELAALQQRRNLFSR